MPSNVIREGTETIDGVEFRFTKVTEAEGITNLLVELPGLKTLLPQDLVYHRVYPFVGELHGPERKIQCFDGWIRALRQLQAREYELVLPGHGEPTGAGVLDEMIGRLETIRGIVAEAADAEEFKRRVQEAYPDYRLPLLVDLSTLTLYDLIPSGTAAAAAEGGAP